MYNVSLWSAHLSILLLHLSYNKINVFSFFFSVKRIMSGSDTDSDTCGTDWENWISQIGKTKKKSQKKLIFIGTAFDL